MNTIVLTVAVACALASIGLAAWVWLALISEGDELRDLAGFEAIDFDKWARSPRSNPSPHPSPELP